MNMCYIYRFIGLCCAVLLLMPSAPVFSETINAGGRGITIMYGFRSADGRYYLKLDNNQQIGDLLCLKNDAITYPWKGMMSFLPEERDTICGIMDEDIEKGLGAPGVDLVLYPDGAVFAFYNGKELTVDGITAKSHPTIFTLLHKNGRIRECVLGKETVYQGIRCAAGEMVSFHPGGRLKSAMTLDDAVIKGKNYNLYYKKGAMIGLDEYGAAFPFDGENRLLDGCTMEIDSVKVDLIRGVKLETGSGGAVINKIVHINGPYLGKPSFEGKIFVDRKGFPLSVPGGGLVYTVTDASGRLSAFFTPHRSEKKEWNGIPFNKDMYVSIEKMKGSDAGFIKKGEYRLVIAGLAPGAVKGFVMPEGFNGGYIIKPDGQTDMYAMLISRGWHYLIKDKPEAALSDFTAAVAAEPGMANGYLNLAHCYNYYKKDRIKALSLYEEAFKKGENPYSPLFYDVRSDGRFMKEILKDPEFSALQKKYKKRR